MNEPITKREAEFFMDQCIGTSNGHMAEIPNAPTIRSIFSAYVGGDHLRGSGKEFAIFLHAVADQLDPKETDK